MNVRDFALKYIESGLSVIPIKMDGTKSPPPMSWKPFQERRPSPYEVSQIFRNDVGVAILGGKVSGNLEIIDIERGDIVLGFEAAVNEISPALVAKLPKVRTPRGGAHLYYRTDAIEGNQKLAQEIDDAGHPKVRIETRGEGGYVLAPPSPPECHPTKKTYEHVGGPPLTEIPTITPEERKVLFDCARSFNLVPREVKKEWNERPADTNGNLRPGDDFNARATWEEILKPKGWEPVKQNQNGGIHWRRPGKEDKGTSATTGQCGDRFYCFSSNAAPFEPDTAYTKFTAYAILWFGGDFSAASKELAGKGFGKKAATPAPPAKVVKAAKKISGSDADQYFEGKEFLPERLATEIATKHKLIATPIGDDGFGVRIYVYRDGAFRQNGESVVVDEAYRALGETTKRARVKDVAENIRISKKVDYENLNKSAKQLINVKNGMLDWKTGTVVPHDFQYYSTLQIETDYDPSAESKALDDFLSAILPADAIPMMEEFIGYLLIPDTSFNKCLVIVGEGGNGKTTLLDFLMGFLGEDNISHFSLHHISEERFSTAGLFGSLANFYDELQTKQVKDSSTFKIITGGSPLKAEDKGKSPFSFRPFCRLIFSANEMPRSDDRSQAYFDRFIFVRLPNRIRGTRVEVREYSKVLLAMPGVKAALLNRAISGLRRLTENGKFSPTPSSQEVIEDYRRECNSAYDFMKEFCTFDDPTAWIHKRDFYDRYKLWCIETTRKPMAFRGFGKNVEAMNVRSARRNDGWAWSGIDWTNGTPPATKADEVRGFGDDQNDRDPGGQRDLDF